MPRPARATPFTCTAAMRATASPPPPGSRPRTGPIPLTARSWTSRSPALRPTTRRSAAIATTKLEHGDLGRRTEAQRQPASTKAAAHVHLPAALLHAATGVAEAEARGHRDAPDERHVQLTAVGVSREGQRHAGGHPREDVGVVAEEQARRGGGNGIECVLHSRPP